MRVTLALGVAFAALAMTAYAQPDQTRVFVRHGGDANLDGDQDGWLSRAEAAAGAERMFGELDSNNDGRLTREDHRGMHEEFDVRHGPEGLEGEDCTTTVEPADAAGGGERRVTVICGGPGAEGGRRVERRVTRRGDDETAETEADGERVIERHVTVMRGDHGEHAGHAPMPPMPPHPPMPPMPPHPPMAMMLFAHSEEADINGDDALSRDEFRAQQVRFFDASDINGDGRVRLRAQHGAAQAPQPPIPPAPPAPPRRH